MRIGSKKIFHLEAWAVKVMSLYKVSSYFTFLPLSRRSRDIPHNLVLNLISLPQHFFYDIDMSAFD